MYNIITVPRCMEDTLMIAILIHTLEISIVALIGYLSYTMLMLSKSNGKKEACRSSSFKEKGASVTLSHTYSRAESITSAQIFAGLQLLEVKRYGINLHSSGEDWLDNGVSFYLLGAASAITEHFDCRGSQKDDVMRFLLTKNLKLTEEKAEKYISELYQVNDQTIEENAFDAGINAAKTWLTKKFIPEEHSLLSNLHTWGFIA